jgi:hypothetical protein
VLSVEPVFGDPALAERIAKHEIKGNLLAARPSYVRERWGDEALQAVASRLEPATRALVLGEILPFRWYPLPVMAEVDRAIVEGPMEGDAALMKDFGATIARYDLTTLYRVLFRVGTPAFVIRRINTAYRAYIKGGSMAAETPTSLSARVSLVDGAFPLYLCTWGVAGWLTAALELSGAQAVDVRETHCVHRGDARCTWQASWTKGG